MYSIAPTRRVQLSHTNGPTNDDAAVSHNPSRFGHNVSSRAQLTQYKTGAVSPVDLTPLRKRPQEAGRETKPDSTVHAAHGR